MPAHSPIKADFVVSARWVVPVEPAGAVLEHHAVVVADGRIVALLPAAEALERHADAVHMHRPEHALLPGFVNAHTHSAMSLLRGLADDLPLDAWLKQHIWPAELRWSSPEFVRDGARLAMLEMLRGGTTCFNDMYFFPDVVAGLAVEHHLRACVGMVLFDQPTPWADTPDEYFRKGLAVHDQYRDHPLVRVGFAPHAPYTVSDEMLGKARLLADELDLTIHTHVHETRAEVEQSVAACGLRPLARLERLGLLSNRFSGVHATELSAEDITALAANSASVVHCPSSNLKLASGVCDVRRLLGAGVNVALGTDGAASNNTLDMLGEMRLAALLAKGTSGDAAAVPAAQALQLATLNGARALGLDDRIGSLVPGKCADMICIDLSDPATQPVHHVISQLVYAASRAQVSDAWIAGRHLLDDGRAVSFDERGVVERADAWRQRLSAA